MDLKLHLVIFHFNHGYGRNLVMKLIFNLSYGMYKFWLLYFQYFIKPLKTILSANEREVIFAHIEVSYFIKCRH